MKNQVFESNPNMKEYFETSDGQPFYKKQDADLHATSLKDKKVTLVERPAKDEKPKTAAEVIELISVAETVEAVEALIEGDERKTVIAAGQAAIEALS
jgi:hypothetical protein